MAQRRNDLRESFVRESFVDLLNDRRQPASSLTVLAEAADILEEHGNAEHLRCVVGAFQRAADVDPEVKSSLDELSSCSKKLGRRSPGANSYAVRAVQDLFELMTRDPSFEGLHCDPDDLGRIVYFDTLAGKHTWDSLETYPIVFQTLFATLIENAVRLRQMARQLSRLRRSTAGLDEAAEPVDGPEGPESGR